MRFCSFPLLSGINSGKLNWEIKAQRSHVANSNIDCYSYFQKYFEKKNQNKTQKNVNGYYNILKNKKVK